MDRSQIPKIRAISVGFQRTRWEIVIPLSSRTCENPLIWTSSSSKKDSNVSMIAFITPSAVCTLGSIFPKNSQEDYQGQVNTKEKVNNWRTHAYACQCTPRRWDNDGDVTNWTPFEREKSGLVSSVVQLLQLIRGDAKAFNRPPIVNITRLPALSRLGRANATPRLMRSRIMGSWMVVWWNQWGCCCRIEMYRNSVSWAIGTLNFFTRRNRSRKFASGKQNKKLE